MISSHNITYNRKINCFRGLRQGLWDITFVVIGEYYFQRYTFTGKHVTAFSSRMVVLTFFIGYCNSKISFPIIFFSSVFFFHPQRIQGHQISNSLSMFGQSISSGIDADNNGYQGELNNFCLFFIFRRVEIHREQPYRTTCYS